MRVAMLISSALLGVPLSAHGAARQPDLIVRTLNVSPGQTSAGGTLSVLARVMNRGHVAAKASTLGFYLSKDGRKDKGDLRLLRVSVKALGASKEVGVVRKIKLPATRTGAFHLVVCADDRDQINEGSERNCNPSGLVTIKPSG